MACPNCGGELVSKLEVKDEHTEEVLQTVEPEGGVLVCVNCNQAATPEEGNVQAEAAEAPDESNVGAVGPRAEDFPREEGTPAPPAPPTTQQAGDPPPGPPDATEAAEKLAAEEGVSLHSVEGTGAGGTITKPDVEGALD